MLKAASDRYPDLRDAVRALCSQFPDEYHRKLDEQRAYPESFVDSLTRAGWLAAMIPSEYGGSGLGLAEASVIMEEINRSGGNSGACHGQMYNIGTLLRHGSPEQKRHFLPKIASGEWRLQYAHRRGFEEIRRDVDLHGRPAPGSEGGPDRAADRQHGQPRDQRALLRQPGDPGRKPDRPGRPGLPLHPRRPERRAHLDCRRMHRRRLLVHRPGDPVRDRACRVRPPDRPEPGRAVSDRRVLHRGRSREPDALAGLRAVRRGRALRRPSQHGEVPRGQGVVGGRQCLHPVPRRLRLRPRIRHRAQVSRNPAVPGGADLDQPGPVLRGRARARATPLLLSAPMRPLDGITVVALEHAIAAPFCTRQLADLGARVIKIERPGVGDFARAYDSRVRGQASHFVWTNRSKESLTLDLKHPEARAILEKLLPIADVLVQNLAPGSTARLGLSYESLRERYPKLIVCDISGYGSDGPYRDKKAYDLLIQSESGFLSVTGSAEEPVKAGCSIADIAAGMYALSNILAALIERGRTGQGKRIEVSMLEAMIEWMSYPLYYAFDGAPPPPRAGAAHATIYPYGPFPTGDGRTVMLGLQNEREWRAFCDQVLRRPELAADERFSTNSRRTEARPQLREIIVQAFALLTADQVVARLDEAQIANARINDMREVWEHPQLKARRRWVQVDTPAGPVPALLPPGAADVDAVRMDAVPALGQHTEAILAGLGYGAADIDRLRRLQAI